MYIIDNFLSYKFDAFLSAFLWSCTLFFFPVANCYVLLQSIYFPIHTLLYLEMLQAIYSALLNLHIEAEVLIPRFSPCVNCKRGKAG